MNSHFDAQPTRRGFGDAIMDFNQWVCDQPELEQIVLPIRDGVSLIRRRQFPFDANGDATTAGGTSSGSNSKDVSKQTTPESDA